MNHTSVNLVSYISGGEMEMRESLAFVGRMSDGLGSGLLQFPDR